MNVNVKKLNENAIIPTKAHSSDAGFDLYALTDAIIEPHTTVKVQTGIAMEIPEGYFGGVYARSGLSTKEGLRPANCTGVVDCGYLGDITVALHNDTNEERIIIAGDRIAQLIIQPYLQCELNEVELLSDTERGEGGFGSSGKN